MLIFTLTVLSVSLGCVSAEDLDDTNSTLISLDDNSQLDNINNENYDNLLESDENNEILNSEDCEDILTAGDVSLEIVNGKSSYTTSESITVKMGSYSMASSSDVVSVFLNGKQVASTTYTVITNSGYAVPLTTAQTGSNSIYCTFTATSIWSVTSDTVTFTVSDGGSVTPAENASAAITIYDMNYPSQSTITYSGDYVCEIAYNLVKTGSSFSDETFDVYVNSEYVGSTTLKSQNRIGNLTFNESKTWEVYVVYSATADGSRINATSNTLTIITTNAGGSTEVKTLTVSIADVTYPSQVTAVVKSNVDGTYTITVGTNTYSVTVSNGQGSVSFTLPAGSYTATVTSNSDSALYNSTSFTVNSYVKQTPSIETSSAVSNDKATISVTMPNDISNEKITVTLNGKTVKEAVLSNGKATVEFDNLEEADYSYKVSYSGNDRYNSADATGSFTVESVEVKTTLLISISDAVVPNAVTVTVKSNVDDTYTVSIAGQSTFDVVVSNGEGSKSLTLPAGDYTANVVSKSDSTLYNSTSFKVTKVDVSADDSLNIPTDSTTPTISLDLAGDATGTFTVTVDGNSKTVNVLNGKASVTLDELTDGNHTVTISYSGDDKYSPVYKTVTYIVVNNIVRINESGNNYFGSTIEAYDLIRAYNSPYDFRAVFYDKNGNLLNDSEVNFIINGNDNVVTTDEYGVAKLVNKLEAGSYAVEIRNLATGEVLTKNIVIVNRITNNKDIIVDYTYSAVYKIQVFSDNGQPAGVNEKVVLTLNNVKYNVFTDKDGFVTFKIPSLIPKTYDITAEYKGVKVSNKVVVKQILKAKNKKFKKAKKVKKYKATLKTSAGKAIASKKITLKVKGKTYKAKTNAKGVATFKIKNLKKAGKYKATVKYLNTSVKKTITVKK